MDLSSTNKIPLKRKEDRVILQFDYDCFYAQVCENRNPKLKSQPLGIKQKNILATCNYNARRRGVKKLMLIVEAKKICPELVLADGEDLTPFRDMSKTLFNFLKSHSWNGKVERLGFDEVFMDVTDIIDYNISCLNELSLHQSYFHLSNKDPEHGFECDLTTVVGCIAGAATENLEMENPLCLRLVLGSHLAQYLRLRLEQDFGYTSTCGISTNKLLSKLVGSQNKPRNQTTLLAMSSEDILAFVDGHKLRTIPGIGSKITHTLESFITSENLESLGQFDSHLTAHTARVHPRISPAFLETLLSGPGAERGIGIRIWGLLHGVDQTEVKEANDVPSQISIEDTYKGLTTVPQITEELHKLSCSLIRRMRVDLVVRDETLGSSSSQKWTARPRTVRLSIRSWPQPGSETSNSFSRISRSGPLPNFIFDLQRQIDDLAEQLVVQVLLQLLRRLQDEKPDGWNLQLINICVANMVAGAADDKLGAGRDISVMFKRQDEVLKPWRIAQLSDEEHESPSCPVAREDGPGFSDADAAETVETKDERGDEADIPFDEPELDSFWEATDGAVCATCGHRIPSFALSAHLRYHELDG